MKVLRIMYNALKFWIVQNLIELFLIIALGYIGIDVMGDFCIKCLFIENVEGAIWGIAIKTIIFLIPYLVLFILISFIAIFKKFKTSLKYAIINSIISNSIIILIGIIKPRDISELFLPLLISVISSSIIMIYNIRYR